MTIVDGYCQHLGTLVLVVAMRGGNAMSKKKYDPPEGYEWLSAEENMAWAALGILGLVAWVVLFGKACVG